MYSFNTWPKTILFLFNVAHGNQKGRHPCFMLTRSVKHICIHTYRTLCIFTLWYLCSAFQTPSLPSFLCCLFILKGRKSSPRASVSATGEAGAPFDLQPSSWVPAFPTTYITLMGSSCARLPTDSLSLSEGVWLSLSLV